MTMAHWIALGSPPKARFKSACIRIRGSSRAGFLLMMFFSSFPLLIRGSIFPDAFQPIAELVRVDGFGQTGIYVIPDGIFQFWMKPFL
jgi:hypothetical protein